MILCVDVDDVICNLQETVIGLFNKRFGTHYTINDFNDYDVMNILPAQNGVAMRDMYGEAGLYDKVRPLPGAQDALQKLINMGHQVYFVTAAVPKTYGEKVEFIKRYFSFIDESHIICMRHKWLFKCDVMIEDNLQTLLTKPYYHRVLFDRPWNQSNKDYVYDIHRCHNWDDIVAAVNKINDLE